jgi:hypothetical protein
MDEGQIARMKLECLALAQAAALATHAGTYSITAEARKYWDFIRPPVGVAPAPPKTDDIPF